MFEINTQFVTFGKQIADSAFQAQRLALENFERVAGLQLKTLEERANATFAFINEAAEVRDFEGVKAIFPKGVNLVKESGERFFAVGQEVFGQNLKASETIGQLVKNQLETVGEEVAKAAPKAARTK